MGVLNIQEKLVAGPGISIDNNLISVTGDNSFGIDDWDVISEGNITDSDSVIVEKDTDTNDFLIKRFLLVLEDTLNPDTTATDITQAVCSVYSDFGESESLIAVAPVELGLSAVNSPKYDTVIKAECNGRWVGQLAYAINKSDYTVYNQINVLSAVDDSIDNFIIRFDKNLSARYTIYGVRGASNKNELNNRLENGLNGII